MFPIDPRLLTLSAGSLELQLVPPLGGSVARFDYRTPDGERIPCLRGVEREGASPLDCASFPLVPFANRIRGGRFTFRGREIVLRPNLAGDPSPLHGQGWLAAWEIVSAEPVATTWLDGWGIHLTARGWLYNVRGRDAVLVTLRGGKSFLLGTDEPALLAAALRGT